MAAMTQIETIAHALPGHAVSNDQLKAECPAWDFAQLEKAGGVLSRHVASGEETALDLALQACDQLASTNRLRPSDIGAVVFCTQTPDFVLPPNACLLHGRLNLDPDVVAFDINLGCSGYLYGLQVADSLIRSGVANRVMFATGDTVSRFIHPGDRATRILFGDGAAVTMISKSENGKGLRDIKCGTAGKEFRRVMIPAGGMRAPRSEETGRELVDTSGNVRTEEHLRMDGLGVLSFFNATIPRAVRQTLRRNNLASDDIDLFVFHQASHVAVDTLRRILRIPEDRMVYDFADTGNLTSSSIPVALSRALSSGRAKPGQLALLCGFGQGLSWGTALVDL